MPQPIAYTKWQLFASYFYEVSIEKIKTDINPELEIALKNGQFLLNSLNVNCSYGTNQIAFEREFMSQRLRKRITDNVLMLGFGGGSVCKVLKKVYSFKKMTGIEKDPKVIELCHTYFNIEKCSDLELVQADACDFMRQNQTQYDLIICDVTVGNYVPEICETEEFLNDVKRALSPTGLLIFNKYISDETSARAAKKLIEKFKVVFGFVQSSRVNNIMLIYDGLKHSKQ